MAERAVSPAIDLPTMGRSITRPLGAPTENLLAWEDRETPVFMKICKREIGNQE